MDENGAGSGGQARLNPFTYQREIEEESKFVDREEAREEIQYYLGQASLGECYNIAITGDSSIGKSSLINITQKDAQDYDILAVRIQLDRMNTVSELEFFKELYEVILSEGAEQDKLDENILSKFRDIASGVSLDAEASVGYSSTYVKLTEGGNDSAPRREIVDDLRELLDQKTDASAITLLVDDAQAFSNESLFQKFESIISDLDGYQLILAGTNLSENLPRDYIPLNKSFSSIKLEPFSDVEHTQECLLNPLTEEEEDDFEANAGEIHSFSQGSPFEIRLIGHYMYRHYVKRGEEISLTREVLDEVANSLLNNNPRPEIADRIKQLNADYLLAVVAAVEFPKMTAEELAECMFLYEIENVPENISTVKKRRVDIIERLLSTKILSQDNDAIEFAGNWFDQTYLKYHAASQGLIDQDDNFGSRDEDHPESNIHDKLVVQHLLDGIGETRGTSRFDMEYYPNKPAGEKHHVLTAQFVTEVSVSAGEWTVVDILSPSRREEIYQPLDNALWFRCNIDWLDHGFLTQVIFLGDAEKQREELENRIKDLAETLENLDYELLIENEMIWFHRGRENLQRGNFLFAFHCFEAALSFNPLFGRAWDRRGVALQALNRRTEALVSYKMALKLDPALLNTKANMATIFADQGLYKQAASIFEDLVESDPDYTSAWLRLSRVRAMMDNLEGSNQALESALKQK